MGFALDFRRASKEVDKIIENTKGSLDTLSLSITRTPYDISGEKCVGIKAFWVDAANRQCTHQLHLKSNGVLDKVYSRFLADEGVRAAVIRKANTFTHDTPQ